MNTALRLLWSVLTWAVSILLLNVLLPALERRQILTLTGPAVAFMVGALLLWAGWIYWRQVPAARGIGGRTVYFIAYLAVMALLGLMAVWAAFWINVLIYGL